MRPEIVQRNRSQHAQCTNEWATCKISASFNRKCAITADRREITKVGIVSDGGLMTRGSLHGKF